MILVPSLVTSLLPSTTDLRFEHVEIDTPNQFVIVVTAIQDTAICPDCGQATTRMHSRYTRTLADLPWADTAVQLQLRVRKFFCSAFACPRLAVPPRSSASAGLHHRSM